ncbi:hypothetical protein CJD36_003725 [Flavipsychrobacter stenotrophus]|uniref:Uncharacterized protein n=1 Tax=Flavipsychrobacter stenotrophus TaxID=2077091 RepID=A0A2S7T1N4_9BACT|nr:hypothetical protein CJD36_003725 [Flavipsychrobacter stenotrophus]
MTYVDNLNDMFSFYPFMKDNVKMLRYYRCIKRTKMYLGSVLRPEHQHTKCEKSVNRFWRLANKQSSGHYWHWRCNNQNIKWAKQHSAYARKYRLYFRYDRRKAKIFRLAQKMQTDDLPF